MPDRHVFPPKDADFNDYVQHAEPYLIANKVRLKIDSIDTELLTNRFIAWNNVYPQSQDPERRTTAITKNKNIARKQLEAQIRKIFADIPKSLLTVDDRTTLNLKERDTQPTPAPVPATIPLIELEGHQGHQVFVRYKQEGGERGSSRRGAKPAKISRLEFIYKTGDPAPANPEACNHVLDISRTPHKLRFEPTDSGKRFYGFARWVNTRNQPGPWTDLLSVIIP
jgi:hypothetical protein